MKNSTYVHSIRLPAFPGGPTRPLLEAALRVGDGAAHVGAWIGAEILAAPRRRELTEHGQTALAAAAPMVLGDRFLPAYRWGSGPPVLAIHGWERRAADFAPWIAPVTRAGLSLVAVDAPAHGEASGWRSSLPAFVETVLAAQARLGPLRAIIGEGLGGLAVVRALAADVSTDAAVLVEPGHEIERRADAHAEAMNVSAPMREQLRQHLAARDRGLPTIASTLPDAHHHPTPTLVFGDRSDEYLAPALTARPMAWLRPAPALGSSHPLTVSQSVDFILSCPEDPRPSSELDRHL